MREAQISRFINAQVDHDFMKITDELGEEVTLNEDEIQSLFTLWVQQGGLGEAGAEEVGENPQGLRSEDAV